MDLYDEDQSFVMRISKILGEPKDFDKNKCVVMRMYDGSWMTNDCVEKFPIVCKSPNKDRK